MNIVNATAPLSVDELKMYFQDKTTVFNLDYEASMLKDEKLLVYISNLEIKCDITFNDPANLNSLLEIYLNTKHLVDVPSLELVTIQKLLEHKGIIDNDDVDRDFLQKNQDILEVWTKRLSSLALYNMYCLNDESIKNQIKTTYKTNDDTSMNGINFVSLLKHEPFFEFYQDVKEEDLEYYSSYFNEYIFKGKNLYSYWANENNPYFMFTFGISKGLTPDFNVQEPQET